MNFLLKLVFAGGLISPVVAASHDRSTEVSFGTDSLHVEGAEEKVDQPRRSGLNTLTGLNASNITNPYAAAADQPFTISSGKADAMPAPMATQVLCGKDANGNSIKWTDGEYLGQTGDGKKAYTKIVENRVYFNWGGTVSGNIFVLFFLDSGKFPNNPATDALIKECVNPVDPSTAANNLLGKTNDGKITCNGYVMENGELLGTFVDGGRSTYQYTKYVDGRLRVMIKQGADDTRTDNYVMDLLPETISGQKGYLSDKWKGKLTVEMVNGCYWPIVPKPATPVVENNCASGPALSGITNISQTALRFSFTGTGVSAVTWRIKSGSSEVRSGATPDLGGLKTANISFTSLAPGNYTLEIEGANCSSAVSSRAFTVNEPVVTIPDCQNGPSVSTLSNITPASLTVAFGGTNLRVFSWRILDGTYAVASGKTGTLSTNSTNLSFNYLKNGTYTFELNPVDCKSASVATKSFSVSATDTRTACQRGPSLESLLQYNETGLEFLFDGENIFAIDWKIMNDNNVAVRQNRVAPQNNHPVIQYDRLSDGVYTLQIQGGNCKSAVGAERFGIGVPLPIYIANFKGEVLEKGVELSWEVVAEQDGKEFEILRFNGQMKNAEVLGKVSLTDQRTGLYKFVDEAPLLGVNYYQLKQIDADGTFTRSKLISINPGIINGTVVAPNPAQDYVDVQFSSRVAGESEILIYNAAGVKISTAPIRISEGKNVHRVNVRRLGNGNYFMKISHNGEQSSMRFTKID